MKLSPKVKGSEAEKAATFRKLTQDAPEKPNSGPVKRKYVTWYLDPELITQAKVEAAKNGEHANHLVERALRQYFERQGWSGSVT